MASHPEYDKELVTYYIESLGSSERLDYGTGHELSFLGFLIVCENLNFWSRPSIVTDSIPEASSEESQRDSTEDASLQFCLLIGHF